jgi:hypothetical protein
MKVIVNIFSVFFSCFGMGFSVILPVPASDRKKYPGPLVLPRGKNLKNGKLSKSRCRSAISPEHAPPKIWMANDPALFLPMRICALQQRDQGVCLIFQER